MNKGQLEMSTREELYLVPDGMPQQESIVDDTSVRARGEHAISRSAGRGSQVQTAVSYTGASPSKGSQCRW